MAWIRAFKCLMGFHAFRWTFTVLGKPEYRCKYCGHVEFSTADKLNAKK